MIKVNQTWHNAGPHTIWARLEKRLGRMPTQAEVIAEVKRVLRDDPAPVTPDKGA